MALDKTKVVYQIYPKSYKDTTGNGIGDFRGIIEKIPYLAALGVDMVWLNPFYPSPQRDNGYDISDYTAVNPVFGDMADFEEMVRVGKEHKIDFMLDMVLNHCSTEHEWFQKALAGDKYYQDFFFIQDQPTDWLSKFGGSAWAPFGDTGKYYLHLFDETQADLNWRNPNVRKELFKVVNFWRDKGVKGFRFDVINLIGKDEVLVDCPENEGKPAYTDKPIVHDQPRALNRFVDIKNFRDEGATMLAASIHLSRGTPYIYMGEEIGMIDPDYDSMADYVDVESINAYQMLLDQGKSPEQAFKIIQAKSRDNSRTPMQWDASENAGFSTGTPWLKAGKSYKDINVENEIDGPIFKFYKELIRLRKEMPIISEGSYQPALEDSQEVYAFERHLDGQKLLVLNNFYGSEAEVEIPAEYQSGCVLLSNYDDAELAEKVSFKPYQTLAILVK